MPFGEEYNVLLDPSLLMAEETCDRTLIRAEELRNAGSNIYVPGALMDFLSAHLDHNVDEEVSRRFVQFYAQRNEPYMEQEEPVVPLGYLSGRLRSTEIAPFYPEPQAMLPQQGFRALILADLQLRGEANRYLTDCIFQEWVFLQEQSWIVSRIRRVFDRVTQVGATSIGAGQDAFNWAVRKTRGKDSQDPITHLDRLVSIGKWVAIGSGTAVTMGLLTPPGGIATGLAVAPSFFFLIDP